LADKFERFCHFNQLVTRRAKRQNIRFTLSIKAVVVAMVDMQRWALLAFLASRELRDDFGSEISPMLASQIFISVFMAT